MFTKQHPVNLNSVSTAAALAAHDEEFTANYAEHQSFATDFAGSIAPQFPVENAKWLDTSTTPPVLKRWNGSAWVADITILTGFKNKVINGNFAINQEAVSGTVVLTAGQYGHDMWKAGASGCTYTFATVANATIITITAGSLLQIIEGINLQSGTHVLSWQGTAQGKIDSGSYGVSGITGTAIGGTNLSVEFGTGTLSNVQLEKGAVATPFEERPVGLELILCKRYFQYITLRGHANVTGVLAFANTFPVNMRTIPTLPTGGMIISPYGVSDLSVNISEFQGVTANSVLLAWVSSNNLTIGYSYGLTIPADARL